MTAATWRGAGAELCLPVKRFLVALYTQEISAVQEVKHGPTCTPPVCSHLERCQLCATWASSTSNTAVGLSGSARAVVLEPGVGLEMFVLWSWSWGCFDSNLFCLCPWCKFSCFKQEQFDFLSLFWYSYVSHVSLCLCVLSKRKRCRILACWTPPHLRWLLRHQHVQLYPIKYVLASRMCHLSRKQDGKVANSGSLPDVQPKMPHIGSKLFPFEGYNWVS